MYTYKNRRAIAKFTKNKIKWKITWKRERKTRKKKRSPDRQTSTCGSVFPSSSSRILYCAETIYNFLGRRLSIWRLQMPKSKRYKFLFVSFSLHSPGPKEKKTILSWFLFLSSLGNGLLPFSLNSLKKRRWTNGMTQRTQPTALISSRTLHYRTMIRFS